mmetsp:Transcript_18050/g.38836  ORF Transcript_18050/g.38836 Transcript_18050/m.38836 type:complete len:237 (+) Transcript_18050:596-1306(+)
MLAVAAPTRQQLELILQLLDPEQQLPLPDLYISSALPVPIPIAVRQSPCPGCSHPRLPLAHANLGHGLAHGLVQVRDEVVNVLDTGRDADQVVRQAACSPHLGRDGCMGHVAGQGDEGGHVAEADSHLEQLGLLHNYLGRLHVAGLKAEKGASVCGLAHVDVVAPVGGQAGVVDLLDQRVPGQVCGHLGAVLGASLHAQGHGLEAAQCEPAVHGGQARTLRVLEEVYPLGQIASLD